MTIRGSKLFIAAGLLAGVCAVPAAAITITSYTDKALFLADTGATSASGAIIPHPTVTNIGPVTIGTVVIDAPRWFTFDRSVVVPGGEIGVSQGKGDVGSFVNDGIDATFDAPVDAAGFVFFEPVISDFFGCNTTCVDSTYVVRLVNGTTTLGEVALTHARGSLQFFGVKSDAAFTRLAIRETVGTDDNELYGEFFAHAAPTAVTPAPEPGVGALLLAGLGAIGTMRYRRRST